MKKKNQIKLLKFFSGRKRVNPKKFISIELQSKKRQKPVRMLRKKKFLVSANSHRKASQKDRDKGENMNQVQGN
jgi:hypothetical protein